MAASADRNDPLASFNFIVTVEGMRAGFSEVGGSRPKPTSSNTVRGVRTSPSARSLASENIRISV